jgi:DNA repair protein RecO (recombination protein O)
MGKTLNTEAIVLSRTDVGEEDRILTFLTRRYGLLKAAASGAKTLKGGRTAPLDLFVRSRIQFHVSSKPGKLCRIRSVDVVDPYLEIRGDYNRLCAASYMAEEVAHCVQEADPSEEIFDLLASCLDQLRHRDGTYGVLFIFETRLIRELGMAPEMSNCMICGGEMTGKAAVSPQEGGLLHPDCSPGGDLKELESGDLATLRFVAQRRLQVLDRLKIDDASASRLFRAVHSFAVHHLGFEPKTVKTLPPI